MVKLISLEILRVIRGEGRGLRLGGRVLVRRVKLEGCWLIEGLV